MQGRTLIIKSNPDYAFNEALDWRSCTKSGDREANRKHRRKLATRLRRKLQRDLQKEIQEI